MRLPIISGRNWQYTWLARGSRASRDTQPDECSFTSWEASRDLSIQESHLSESRFHFVFSDIYYFSSKRGKIFFCFFEENILIWLLSQLKMRKKVTHKKQLIKQ